MRIRQESYLFRFQDFVVLVLQINHGLEHLVGDAPSLLCPLAFATIHQGAGRGADRRGAQAFAISSEEMFYLEIPGKKFL